MRSATGALAAVLLLTAGLAQANTPALPPPVWPGNVRPTEVHEPVSGCRIGVPQQLSSEPAFWKGDCPNGVAQGRGKLLWTKSRYSYEGVLRDGRMNDEHGVLEWRRYHYEGGFVDGHLTGQATLRWLGNSSSALDHFTGQFKDGEPEGLGIWVSKSSRKEGEFKHGKLNGRGTVEMAFYRYDGDLVDDVPHGAGVEIRDGGYRYEGKFSHGRFDGEGVLMHPDGERSEGTFRRGKLFGMATQRLYDGTRYDGTFVNGAREGHGVLVMADGGRYEGDFYGGAADGMGLYIAASGERFEGRWHLGCFSDGSRRAAVITPLNFCLALGQP